MAVSRLQRLYSQAIGYAGEDYQELANELETVEAEEQEKLIPITRKLEKVEELKTQIQSAGMSKDTMRDIYQIEQPGFTENREVVGLESFTSFNSQNGVQLGLEELNQRASDILMGGAIALGLGVVIKIIHVIYKWFKNRGEKTGEEIKNKGETAEKLSGQYIDAKAQLDAAAREHAELERELAAAERELAEKKHIDGYKPGNRYDYLAAVVNQRYTRILDIVLSGKDYAKEVIAVFNDVKKYHGASEAALDAAGSLNSSLHQAVKDNRASQLIDQYTAKVYGQFPPKEMTNNLAKIKELIEKGEEYRNEHITIQSGGAHQILNYYKDNSRQVFFKALLQFGDQTNVMFNKSGGEEMFERIVKELQEQIQEIGKEGSSTPKDVVDKLQAFVSYFKDSGTLLVQCMRLYGGLANDYRNFTGSIIHWMKDEKNIFKKAYDYMSKSGKEQAVADVKRYLEMLDEADKGGF